MMPSVPGLSVPAQWRDRLTGVGAKVLPRLPGGAKWLLTGGRAVTLGGSALVRPLQMMRSSRKARGVDGLVIDGDAAPVRSSRRPMTAALAGPETHVATAPVRVPGPAGT